MKYIHPILKREAIYNKETEHYYCKYITDWWEMIWLIKDDLIPLWFQPVEETKTDWIDEAYEEWQHTVTSNDIKYFYRDEFRQAIEKHQPKSDVCNLVPIDKNTVKKLSADIYVECAMKWSFYIEKCEEILSKYGTTPQKKWTRKDIQYYIDIVEDWLTKDWSELWGNVIRWFLAYNWLLED